MQVKVALAGNPNCGKTTLFNNVTGNNQHVGNWPGVTVEKKEGQVKGRKDVIIQDLPGIYSLSPYTLEEVVTRNYLIQERPDAILNILDGSNLERNLYLTTQLIEIGIPMVIAMNMMDVVRKNGDKIDRQKLSELLGCEIIETSAVKGEGNLEAVDCAVKAGKDKHKNKFLNVFSGTVEHVIAHIEDLIRDSVPAEQIRWYAIKLFERDSKVLELITLSKETSDRIEKITTECEAELDDDSESIITNERYAYISKLMKACVTKKRQHGDLTISDKIDRIVTNRILALPIFAVVMFVVYFLSITTVGTMLTDFTNDVIFGEWILPGLQSLLTSIGTADWLVGLLVDGIIGGVGAVLGFLPQMLVLFLLLALLEDIGYMARIAFIMDRVFRKFGLSGKSFIPMLIGSGCSVPGIMASRTIENDRDRRITIITTSFVPCSAKIPIVGLIAGALFGNAWWVATSAYFLGIAAVIVSGVILKKTKLFAGDPAPFVMELPAYHIPRMSNVFRSVFERGWSFVKRAGTVIMVASVVIWFLANFGFTAAGFGMIENMDESILAVIGGFVAPLFSPLGFGTWQATVATVMGLIAKEEVVGVFGVLFGVSGDALAMVEEGSFGGLSPIASHFTALSAYSFLVFNLLCAPCFAAMGAIKREMNSAKWTTLAIAYLCLFAYFVSFMFFQFGSLFTGAGFTVGTALAFLVLFAFVFLLVRPDQKQRKKLATNT